MRHEITLQELANSLNLSVSTVSKSLNNSPEISVKTKSRVKELAVLKRYIPNSMAQSLKGKQSRTIGVIIPDIFSNFFSEALHAIEKRANKRGYHTIICFSNDTIIKESECIDRLIKCRVDGIIIAASKESLQQKSIKHIEAIATYEIPLVMFDRLVDTINCDKVGLNETVLSEEATMHLVNLGFRKIALFTDRHNTCIAEAQSRGYIDGINREGLKKQFFTNTSLEFTPYRLQKMIRLGGIEAILASDGAIAYSIARNLQECGLKLPEDIYILSLSQYENRESGKSLYGALDRRGEEQGDIAADTVIDRVEGVLLPQKFLKFELKALNVGTFLERR